ncbi:sigma 54-interacting transcriptional regulator [Caproiciproducens faecalis]|uniref:PrpR N-terminal domain-containing protein n=1 Tax=Caproiciproducens faecalis TaxID=2820301 RepID=A0ABS7DJM2_9FIRM|nr:sigma 54-interacting transcriptional regulator [Caproiciproducens faecalis]MBW7571418.1 PrpR N-terminal domain-containing protein [Caproiciproducens faecalis]
MIEQARAASVKIGLPLKEVKLVSTADVVNEANLCVKNGIDIIIARGAHALLIKQYTNIPVVEIVLTSQELGLLITQAKAVLHKDKPTIAFIGPYNMFCNMDYFGQIFNVHVLPSYVRNVEDLTSAVDIAAANGADLIIGGDCAIKRAQEINMRSLFLASTQDSIDEALRVAKMVAYATDLEKKTNAELSVLLNYSFNGIVKTDNNGCIVIFNHIAKTIFRSDLSDKQIIGLPLTKLIPDFHEDTLQHVLKEGDEIYSTYMTLNHHKVMANLVPIKVKETIEGAIFSFHEIKKLAEINDKIHHELYQAACVAQYNFSLVGENSDVIGRVIQSAKFFASSDAPVLISGEEGTEKEVFAECIHNASLRSNAAYVSLDCSAMSEEEQKNALSDDVSSGKDFQPSPLHIAQLGTLVLSHIEKMTPVCQRILFRILQNKVLSFEKGDAKRIYNIRVVATTDQNLCTLTQQGGFNAELYYMLSTLTLEIPPLRERPEDISYWAEEFLKEKCSRYSRFLSLTAGAQKALCAYPWPGNLTQLKSFCERLVVTAPRRSVDETFINSSLESIYPTAHYRTAEGTKVIYQDPRAADLMALLAKYHGNRTLVARDMNISTTTLWRKMKKYNLPSNYK